MRQDLIRQTRRGFTLTELVIVVAIVGVLLAIGGPALWEIAQEIKLKQASRELITAMRSARYKAISEVRDYGVMARFPNRIEIFQGDDPATGTITREFLLPTAVFIKGPTDAEPGGSESIDDNGGTAGDPGFDENDDGGWVVFRPDGSSDNEGAIRLGNINDHYFEVRVDPSTTARMIIRTFVGPDLEDDWEDGG